MTTFGFATDTALSDYIVLPAPEFGDSKERRRGQMGKETTGGYTAVTDRGYQDDTYALIIREMTQAEKIDAEEFFETVCEHSKNTFWMIWSNERSAASWNALIYPLCSGSTISSAILEAGDTIDGSIIEAGQSAAIDYHYIGPLRLRPGGLKFTSRWEGIYETSIVAVLEHA